MKCCDIELEFKEIGGINPKIMRATCEVCDLDYDKKQYSDIVYKFRPGIEDFVCTKCGEDIITTQIAHTVRDGLFSLSGSGKVQREPVPYCPKCEKKPVFHGSPITSKDT